jgi:hypothetical protein
LKRGTAAGARPKCPSFVCADSAITLTQCVGGVLPPNDPGGGGDGWRKGIGGASRSDCWFGPIDDHLGRHRPRSGQPCHHTRPSCTTSHHYLTRRDSEPHGIHNDSMKPNSDRSPLSINRRRFGVSRPMPPGFDAV